MEKLPIYDIEVNENDETGVSFNSFVENPAHQKNFIVFEKQEKYYFDAEKKQVIGVVIAADELIYRNSPEIGEHYVLFSKESIKKIMLKLSKNNFFNSVNKEHSTVVEGVYLTSFFQTDKAIGLSVPTKLASQNIKDGSLIAVYTVENQEIINGINEGKFKGFSIEGLFEKEKIEMSIKTKIENMKNPFEKFFKKAPKKENFGTAITQDGQNLSWDGELEIDKTVINVVAEDGTELPAPAGDLLISLEDGTVAKITVNAEGVLTAVEEEKAEVEEEVAAKKEAEEKMAALRKENEILKLQLSKFNKDFKKPEKSDSIDFFEMAKRIKNN